MREFLIKVRKNIQNALKVQIATVHRSMQNPLINTIHQSIGVVMDTFLELVAEEIRFSANEILKDMRNTKRRPACTTHCRSKFIGAFQISKQFLWNEAISIICKFCNCDCWKKYIYEIKSPLSLWFTNWPHLDCFLEV